MAVFHSHSEEETKQIAAELAGRVGPGTVIAFTGGMGMGKTAFTSGFLRGLGRNISVSSPTFSLINDYGGDPPVYHFDMYRIDSYRDLESTGFFDYIDGYSIILIEWSENIKEYLPDGYIPINISPGDSPDERIITTGVVRK